MYHYKEKLVVVNRNGKSGFNSKDIPELRLKFWLFMYQYLKLDLNIWLWTLKQRSRSLVNSLGLDGVITRPRFKRTYLMFIKWRPTIVSFHQISYSCKTDWNYWLIEIDSYQQVLIVWCQKDKTDSITNTSDIMCVNLTGLFGTQRVASWSSRNQVLKHRFIRNSFETKAKFIY